MFSVKNIFFKSLHNGFRKSYPIIKKLMNLKKWEGDFWHYVFTPIWGERTLFFSYDTLIWKIRPNHLTDLTAIFGRPEESEIEILLQKILFKGAIFIDVGAHIGRYTLKAAKIIGDSGRVIAFEPDERNCRLLRFNCMHNGFGWIEIENYALGDKNSDILMFSGSDAATNTVMPLWHQILNPSDKRQIHQTIIPIRKGDIILEEKKISHVDLMKIDVEGAEKMVFYGLKSWFQNCRINKIICEVHSPVVKVQDIITFLEPFGYRIRTIGDSEIYATLD